MLLELMSNGTLAELPPEPKYIPDSLTLPDDASVILLLPHNKYLLGTGSDKWLVASGTTGTSSSVYLYDNEALSLPNDGDRPTILPARTVNALLRKLTMHAEPPGRHSATVLMLRTMMREHQAFNSVNMDFLDEREFAAFMDTDEVLKRAYWTTRFALARWEMETVRRIKSWLKAGPEVFSQDGNTAKIWFSIQSLPEREAIDELRELSFAEPELFRMAAQNISPLVLYNPVSGWLILGRFGRGKDVMFSVWAFINHDLWQEIRERRKLTIQDIINAVWGEYDTIQALDERAKYK